MLSLFKDLGDAVRFITREKKYWLIPILVIVVFLGGLLIVVKTAVVPAFMYSF